MPAPRPTTSLRRASAAVAAAATGLMAACGATGGEQPGEGRALGLGMVEYEPSGEGGAAAALASEVVDDGGCLRLRYEVDGSLITPVFPVGSDAATLTVGERVELGGGQASSLPAETTVPDVCADADATYWIVNAG